MSLMAIIEWCAWFPECQSSLMAITESHGYLESYGYGSPRVISLHWVSFGHFAINEACSYYLVYNLCTELLKISPLARSMGIPLSTTLSSAPTLPRSLHEDRFQIVAFFLWRMLDFISSSAHKYMLLLSWTALLTWNRCRNRVWGTIVPLHRYYLDEKILMESECAPAAPVGASALLDSALYYLRIGYGT